MCVWDVNVLLRRFSARGTALEKRYSEPFAGQVDRLVGADDMGEQ